MNKKEGLFLLILLLLSQFKISKSLNSSSANYSACIGEQGALLSSQNYTLLMALNSPAGNSSSLSYKLGLGFISECIESICCNFNSICNVGETQQNCPEDCKTEIKIIPSESFPGSQVNVVISFSDSRYNHKAGGMIKINLLIDSTLNWNPSYGCFSDLAIYLASSRPFQTCNWNFQSERIMCDNYQGNMTISYFQNENKLEINGKCKLPGLPPGVHQVNGTVSFYLFKE
ncbi:MAG: hypothetical protein QW472_05165 [Candidatus Aenigmatarchaeota archaeon]